MNTVNNMMMEIMKYEEREELKKIDYKKHADLAHYHRFLEGFGVIGEDGIERISTEVAPSFETYCRWKREYVGWSYGMIRKPRPCWRDEFILNPPEPNILECAPKSVEFIPL